MADNKTTLTDAEIKKALKCCSIRSEFLCFDKNCPLLDEGDCMTTLSDNALDLINRLEADKEALIAGQETLQKALAEKNTDIERLQKKAIMKAIKTAKAEAIKEFAERLKGKRTFDLVGFEIVHISDIDSLVKEMVGDAE